jgi:hypothetical protein
MKADLSDKIYSLTSIDRAIYWQAENVKQWQSFVVWQRLLQK